MRADYAEQYRRLWNEHWWWRSRERFVVDAIAGLGLPPGLRILDVGCGDGLFFPSLERFGIVDGLESDRSLLGEASANRRIRVGALDRHFQAAATYDLVVMLDVLEHIEDDLGALQALRRSMSPGGRLMITVPALSFLWSRHDEVNHHHRRYGPRLLRDRLAEAGLEVEFVRFFFSWTVVPLLVRRWLKPALFASGRSDETALLKDNYRVGIPPGMINRALMLLSNLDHWLGAPIGTSLIAVARLPVSSVPPPAFRRKETTIEVEAGRRG